MAACCLSKMTSFFHTWREGWVKPIWPKPFWVGGRRVTQTDENPWVSCKNIKAVDLNLWMSRGYPCRSCSHLDGWGSSSPTLQPGHWVSEGLSCVIFMRQKRGKNHATLPFLDSKTRSRNQLEGKVHLSVVRFWFGAGKKDRLPLQINQTGSAELLELRQIYGSFNFIRSGRYGAKRKRYRLGQWVVSFSFHIVRVIGAYVDRFCTMLGSLSPSACILTSTKAFCKVSRV